MMFSINAMISRASLATFASCVQQEAAAAFSEIEESRHTTLSSQGKHSCKEPEVADNFGARVKPIA